MFSVGDRVTIDGGTKAGVLRYLGPTKFRQGVWAGVELDGPMGKNDGSVDGEYYFRCRPDYGIFVHPSKLFFVDSRKQSGVAHSHPLGQSVRLSTKADSKASHPPTTTATRSGSNPTAPVTTLAPATNPVSERKKKISLDLGEKALPFMTPVKSMMASMIPPTSLMAPNHTIDTTLKTFNSSNPFNETSNHHSTSINPSAPTEGNALDKYSLPAMEEELRRRAQAVKGSKQALDEARMAISNPQDVSEYEKNRDDLITLVDTYERCMNKYDRQLRRIGHLYKKHAGGRSQSSNQVAMEDSHESLKDLAPAEAVHKGPDPTELLEELQEANQRMMEAESNCISLQHELEGAMEKVKVAQEQLQYQLNIVAKLNVDRGNLKKENSDLKAKLETVFINASEETDAISKQASETLHQLERENGELKSALELLTREKQNLEATMRETFDDVERTQDDTTQTASKLEVLINEKDAEIGRLCRSTEELKHTMDQLRREKEIADGQIRALQNKVIDLQDNSGSESKHRAQVEALRQSLDENWQRYSADLAERDALIEDMRQQLSILSKPIKEVGMDSVSTVLASLGVVDRLNPSDGLQKVAGELAGLQVRYAELYKSKMNQDMYYSTEIKKLKQRAAAKRATTPESPVKGVMGASGRSTVDSHVVTDLENQLKDAQSELEHLKSSHQAELTSLQKRVTLLLAEQEKVKSEKKLESEALQRRLARVQNERDEMKQRLDQVLEVELPSTRMEIETLRKELDDVKKEKELLKESLDTGSLSTSIELATSRSSALEAQLNSRTEQLIRAEAAVKEHTKTIVELTASIEHVKRELNSKVNVHQTEVAILQKRISELQSEIRLLSGDRSHDDLARQLEEYKQDCAEARREIDRLKNAQIGDADSDRLRKKISGLLQDIATKDVRLEALQAVIDGFKQGSGEQRLIEKLEKELEEKRRELSELLFRLRQTEESTEVRFSEYEKQIEALQAEKTRLVNAAQSASIDRVESDKLIQTLQHETKKREEAERAARHQSDLIELAEEELKNLQRKLAEYEDAEQQRRSIASKYQALRDETSVSMQRIEAQNSRILELEARLREAGVDGRSAASSSLLSRSASSSRSTNHTDAAVDAEAYQKLIEERDMALAERDHLQRMNTSLEHEKRLLEAELASVKETLKSLKKELGISQQHELLTKAGYLIEELAETRQESWSVLTPFKSLASFMRVYKPAEVDVGKLQQEYETLRKTLEAYERGEASVYPVAQANIVPGLTVDAYNEGKSDDRPADACGVCHRPGHTAVECANASDTEDPMRFTLSSFSSDSVRGFSA